MSTTKPGSTIDVTSIPRAVLSAAIGVVHTVERVVIGDARIRTARGNAWEAICADRDRARRRAEIQAQVATLTAAPREAARRDRHRRQPGQPNPVAPRSRSTHRRQPVG